MVLLNIGNTTVRHGYPSLHWWSLIVSKNVQSFHLHMAYDVLCNVPLIIHRAIHYISGLVDNMFKLVLTRLDVVVTARRSKSSQSVDEFCRSQRSSPAVSCTSFISKQSTNLSLFGCTPALTWPNKSGLLSACMSVRPQKVFCVLFDLNEIWCVDV